MEFVPVHGTGMQRRPCLALPLACELKECIPGFGTGLAAWGARESRGNIQL